MCVCVCVWCVFVWCVCVMCVCVYVLICQFVKVNYGCKLAWLNKMISRQSQVQSLLSGTYIQRWGPPIIIIADLTV